MKTMERVVKTIEQFKNENTKIFFLTVAILFAVLCFNVFG
jgi:hypothetical protein